MATHIFSPVAMIAVFALLCFFTLVLADGKSSPVLLLPSQVAGESSPLLRLPSQAAGEGQNLCAGVKSSPPSSCPVKCFRTDPVCGVDGVTYWCGCAEAACAGAKVAKLGFCEVGNGVSAPLSGQALLLVHIVWLIVLGFSVFFGLF